MVSNVKHVLFITYSLSFMPFNGIVILMPMVSYTQVVSYTASIYLA